MGPDNGVRAVGLSPVRCIRSFVTPLNALTGVSYCATSVLSLAEQTFLSALQTDSSQS